MNTRPALLALMTLCFSVAISRAQQINGTVSDIGSRQPMRDVHIENIHTGSVIVTDSAGRFSLPVDKGQLIEFRKTGYKTERMRIPEGIIPPFFKIFLEVKPVGLPEYLVYTPGLDWKRDSLHYYETFKHALDFPVFSALDAIQHPFSALSKRNRQIWAFQKEYHWFEQEKFVDYTFNERLISNLTGLQGDSAQSYLKMFRPTYEQLRSMREYDFFTYIRRSVEQFRAGYDPRRPRGRGGY